MKTVPTLCATTTIVSTSALGLAFGKPSSLDPTSKRNTTPAKTLDDKPMPSTVQTSSSTNPVLSLSSPLPLSTSSSSRIASSWSEDGRLKHRGMVRRMTSGDANQQDHSNNGLVLPGEYNLDDIDPASTLRSRPSWLKRLSQHSSRNSSPGPTSPSVSCSNGSMAFSHDGSTAPIIGRRSPSPLPPNKLVKRSSSVRTSLDMPSHGSSSRRPTFRRPATSHQRSATLQHHSTLTEMPLEDSSSYDEPKTLSLPDHEMQYTQYFSAKIVKDKTVSKKRSASGTTRSMKRIFPDDRHKPTLLPAKSVSPAFSFEVDESSSQDGESIYFVSRPGTPPDFATVNSPNTPHLPEDLITQGATPSGAAEEARPRRSFSISDFLSSTRKQRPARVSSTKLTRKSSRRMSSSPLHAMGTRQSATAHGEYDRPPQRRNLTDPLVLHRNIHSSPMEGAESDHPDVINSVNSTVPVPAIPQPYVLPSNDHAKARMHRNQYRRTVSAQVIHRPSSPALSPSGGRPSRHSVAPSEQASTLVGSDNEARGVGSGEEDDGDVQSETLFDSLRTGATRSSTGARGPRIETIFDESPPQVSKAKVTALRDLLPKGTFRDPVTESTTGNQSIVEEEESISTPVRTVIHDRFSNGSPTAPKTNGSAALSAMIPSSPPDMPKPLSLGTLEWDPTPGEGEDSRWSFDDEENDEDSWGNYPEPISSNHVAIPISLAHHNPRMLGLASGLRPSLSPHFHSDNNDKDTRSSIFDWSEQQPTDKSSGNRTPPRPSTVHGKKDTDRRGSRTVGRRAPSALHARSQSVPVVPDPTGKRSTVVTNKFGTWGVGSKGVTEDWNDDFDFSDESEVPVAAGGGDTSRIDSGTAMVVPKNIREQQNNVLANIGLLREWGLLIEELKEQRIRASALGLLEGPQAGMWEEVDAMIDLADQEAEGEGVPRLSPPSSPGFDVDAFDDVSAPPANKDRGKRKSVSLPKDELARGQPQTNSQAHRTRRRSILQPNHDIFRQRSSPIQSATGLESSRTPCEPKKTTTRPRKDSEAKARSVIEALQKRRSVHESVSSLKPVPPAKKVPFDTATLRRIVPYVNTLTRRVKDALREAEGLYSTPSTSPKEPPFSKIFQAENDITTQMKLMTVM